MNYFKMGNFNFSAIIPANVRYDKDLKPNAKLLYGEISAFCNRDGSCIESNDYFAKLYNVDHKTISRWVSQLVKRGYIYRYLLDGNNRKIYVSKVD